MNARKIGIIILLFIVFSACSNNEVYFVAQNGSDDNPGTETAPFASIERAISSIQAEKQEGSEKAFKVILREGRYELKKSLVFNEILSGTEVSPLVITSFDNEDVIVSGGRYFKFDELETPNDEIIKSIVDTVAGNKVRLLNLRRKKISDYGEIKHTGFSRAILSAGMELFQGDKAMTLASWPAEGYVEIAKVIDSGSKPRNEDFSNRGGTFVYESSRPLLWSKLNDLWVQGMFGTVWADDKLKVEAIDIKKQTIKTAKPYLYGITGGHFKFMNILEEISKPGDYFIDRPKGIVYIYPFNEEDIAVTIMEEPLVSIEGAENVTFENITFENGRGLGAYVEHGHNNLFNNCTFRNFGSYAVSFGKGVTPFKNLKHEGLGELQKGIIGSLSQSLYADVTLNRQAGTNNGLKSCKIYNTGAGGVSLGGGDVKTLTPANNYVDQCEIFHTGLRYQTYSPGIHLTGVGNRISGCEIYDSPHSAIIYYGNEHIIEGNEIYKVLLESDDGGAIYTGRDVTAIGTVIRNNYIHHVGSPNPFYHHGYWHGIYLDDYSGGVTIENNIFTDILAGVLISGRNIICKNNILINCERPIVIQHRPWQGIQDKRLEQVDAFKGVWKVRYPEIQEINGQSGPEKAKYWGTKSLNNVSIGSKNPCTIVDRVDSTYLTIRGDLNYSEGELKNLFVDADNNNYTLKKKSPIFTDNPEFQKIDFSPFFQE